MCWYLKLTFQDKFVQIFKVISFEWHSTCQHGKQQHTKGPDIDKEAFISCVFNDFWGEVGWCTALLLD